MQDKFEPDKVLAANKTIHLKTAITELVHLKIAINWSENFVAKLLKIR